MTSNISTVLDKDDMSKKKSSKQKNMKPIETWWNLVNSESSSEKTSVIFKDIYNENLPTMAEMIFSGFCPHACLHCIYPHDYDRANAALPTDTWKIIINKLYNQLAIKTYMNIGRILDDNGLELLSYLRGHFEDIKVGLIDDGTTILPHIETLQDIKLDWIDISVDGLEREHDLQRNCKGRFRETEKALFRLKEKRIATKINILITATKINILTIPGIIRYFNEKGFKNFFISPVIDFKPWKSNDQIKISDQDWISLFKEIHSQLDEFADVWIEFFCCEIDQILPFIKSSVIDFLSFTFSDDSMCWDFSEGDNNFYVSFEPFSLAGVKDCVISPGGKIIYNKSMATCKIHPNNLIGCAVTDDLIAIYQNMPNKAVFCNYLQEFNREISILRKD